MKIIARLSLILFSLFSISYLVTSVSAEDEGGNHEGDRPHQDCAALHPGGAATHVDPPRSIIEEIEAEYEASCKEGNCGLSSATYSMLEDQGHSRDEVMCFIAEGEAEDEDGNHEGVRQNRDRQAIDTERDNGDRQNRDRQAIDTERDNGGGDSTQ